MSGQNSQTELQFCSCFFFQLGRFQCHFSPLLPCFGLQQIRTSECWEDGQVSSKFRTWRPRRSASWRLCVWRAVGSQRWRRRAAACCLNDTGKDVKECPGIAGLNGPQASGAPPRFHAKSGCPKPNAQPAPWQTCWIFYELFNNTKSLDFLVYRKKERNKIKQQIQNQTGLFCICLLVGDFFSLFCWVSVSILFFLFSNCFVQKHFFKYYFHLFLWRTKCFHEKCVKVIFW